MTIASRYGELFQMSYITRDLDAAMAHAQKELGFGEFHTTEAQMDVFAYGKMRPLHIKAAMINIGRHQFEIIQPISGEATRVYTDNVDLDAHILNFHHVAIAIRGGQENWHKVIAQVKASGDEFALLAPVEATDEDKVCFTYVDTRKRWGHFTEYLWVDETIKPIPAMPDMDA